ncbi:MAG: serine/threonine protein kinase, partial [Pseudonocardia sp.]|nr:serine/threonine protein kinase [Pseudonocardia sp.]
MTSAPPQLPGLTDLSPLGRGGFADVYLARQEHLGRFVAAKVFRVTLADRSAGDQFRAECQAIGRLDRHPNIITVHDANVLPDGRPYILMEQCDSSMQQLLARRGSLPAEEVAAYGATVARALQFAHGSAVLHGDVTPQNILLRATGAPVLADFGLAVLRDYQGNVASGFTMAHAAPETVRYDGAIDERTDVYGLGSTLYTALAGAPPFPQRPGEPDAARANRILGDTPPRPQGPEWLTDLVLAMLAKDPADRPSLTAV